eukprot:scaffold651_cov174-Ochromonas_danica.AAC.6
MKRYEDDEGTSTFPLRMATRSESSVLPVLYMSMIITYLYPNEVVLKELNSFAFLSYKPFLIIEEEVEQEEVLEKDRVLVGGAVVAILAVELHRKGRRGSGGSRGSVGSSGGRGGSGGSGNSQQQVVNAIPMERYICNFIDDVPAPPAGKIDIIYYMNEEAITFQCPPLILLSCEESTVPWYASSLFDRRWEEDLLFTTFYSYFRHFGLQDGEF